MPAAWRGFRWQRSCLQSFVRPEKQYLGFPYSILLRHLYILSSRHPRDSETLFVLELEYGTNSAMRTTLDGAIVPTTSGSLATPLGRFRMTLLDQREYHLKVYGS